MDDFFTRALSRRSALRLISGAIPAAASLQLISHGASGESSMWNADWDRAVILAATRKLDESFDEEAALLKRQIGPEYRYHTNLRDTVAHPTRDSLEYALLLLEAGGGLRQKRACEILARILPLQNVDAASKWYGLWGYYIEEPPEKMSPADWNWADFNGATLLMINERRGRLLPKELRARVREGIRHAAYSVRRRNVSMNYTNIAVKGTFVTLAAAEALDDRDLGAYAVERLHRFAKNLDATGSFAEYNSPTYAQVSLANFTRLRMLVKNPEARALAARLEHRLWEHLAAHWHASTAQFAGPMSRCYRTDIGAPLWLQKSLGGAITFASLADIRAAQIPVGGEVGLLEFRCPDDLKGKFVRPTGTTEHRELFAPGSEKMRPVQGTTYLAPRFSLGSINRGDFWVQRRPLLAYWGNAERPARYLQVRLMKDDYDFSSALFYSVQNKNCVLGAVNFCTPGGDKHLSLDPVKNGELTAARLYLQFLINEKKESLRLLADGEPPHSGDGSARFSLPSRLAIETSGCRISIAPRLTIFGDHAPSLQVVRGDAQTTVELHLLGGGGESQLVKWSDVRRAIIAFTVVLDERTGSDSLTSFDARSAKQKCEITQSEDQATVAWESPAGRLQLSAGKRIVSAADQHQLFAERVNGSDVPVIRLSEARLDS